MTVRPDDLRDLTGLGIADHCEQDALVVVLEKVRDVGSVVDRVDPHVRIPLGPHLDFVIE